MVLLYFFITEGSSAIRSAFPFSNTGFFSILRNILITRSVIENLYQ